MEETKIQDEIKISAASEDLEEVIPSMDDMKEELEKSFRRVRPGDTMTGTVISVDETEALLDLDYFAPGKIAAAEFSDDPKFEILNEVKVGDSVTATVLRTDDGTGCMVLSARQANHVLAWEHFKQMKENQETVTVTVKEAVKGGVVCYLEGIRGFIPASKLSLTYTEDLSVFVGRQLSVNVITVDEEQQKLVLSAKELLLAEQKREKEERIDRIAVGSVVHGTVEQLMPYGAFVDIGDGITGLVHISQICDKRLQHPKERLSVGQEVKVKIQKIEKGKVSLTMKELDGLLDKDVDETPEEYTDNGSATTSMASLFKNIKL